jgi:mRNA interferase HigB
MVVISTTILIAFYDQVQKAKDPLLLWYYKTVFSDWEDIHSIKQTFNSVDYVGNDRYVFNVGGNKYRLVALINFNIRTVYI